MVTKESCICQGSVMAYAKMVIYVLCQKGQSCFMLMDHVCVMLKG